MKKLLLIALLAINLSAVMAQGNELAENTPPKSREQVMDEYNSRYKINLKVFPNPAANYMIVEPQFSGDGDLKILDMTGVVMAQHHVEPGINKIRFNLDGIANGNYILALYNGGGTLLHVSKFNKE